MLHSIPVLEQAEAWLKRFDEYEAQAKREKAEFQALLVNQDVPLDIRWNLFKRAPAAMVEHRSFYVDYSAMEQLNEGHEVSWYDDFYVERYNTVNIVDIVDEMPSNDDKTMGSNAVANPELYAKLKEEVLAKGVRTFVFDW